MKKVNESLIFDFFEIIEGDYLCTYFKIIDDDCPIPHWELAYKVLLKKSK